MKPITFIHTADLHLGSALKSIGDVSKALQSKLHNATFDALTRIIDAALSNEVDFVLFSGDVYDLESRSIRASRILAEELSRLEKKDIPAYIIAGNHDPLSRNSGDVVELPDNVHIFDTESETLEFTKDGTLAARILGQSYRSSSDSRKMFSHFTAPDKSIWNIGMLHTALDPKNNNYVPCHVDDLKSKTDIHYWALGHIHDQRILNEENPVIAYPGIPQGRDTGETGDKGCLLVELSPNSKPSLTSIPTASIYWDVRELNINAGGSEPPKTLNELKRLFREEIGTLLSEESEDLIAGRIIRWHMTGTGEIHDELVKDRTEAADELTEILRAEFGELEPFVWTESVHIRTGKPVPPLEDLADQSELFEDIRAVMEAMKTEKELTEFDDILGEIWETDGDYEDQNPEKFIMDEDVLQDMITEAGQRIVESLIERRNKS